MTECRRLLGLALFLLAAPAAGQDRTPDQDGFHSSVAPFLKQHCLSCHGPEKQKGQIRLDQLSAFGRQDTHLWTQVHERISKGDMPPEERPRPAAADVRRVLASIERGQKGLRTGGTRRLNRRELSAALQDLTGLKVDYSASLPGDGLIDGFDTGSEALQDAADSVDQNMQVTRRAVEGIRFLDPPSGKDLSLDLLHVKDVRKAFSAWKAAGVSEGTKGTPRLGSGLLIDPTWIGDRGGFHLSIPPRADRRGILRLRVVVAVIKSLPEIPNPYLWVEIGGKTLDHREVTGTVDKPQELIYHAQIEDLAIEPKGVNISLSAKVETPYSIEGYENENRNKPGEEIPGGTGLFRPAFDRKKLPPDRQPIPFVALQSIEVDPDYIALWPPKEWGVDLGAVADDPAGARKLLKLWMERGYRRPVPQAEQDQFLGLYTKLREKGSSFDAALRATFQSVLLSGPFRYLHRTSDPVAPLAQHAIASRLSFMLTGEPPDRTLLRLAEAGKLRDPGVLDGQVDRLLADGRSDAFFKPFVTQWLELGQPITIAMDSLQKQDFRFGRNLKASMGEETIAYVATLFRINRPAKELVESDWTLMNDVLAIHYGYPGIQGGHLRKVTLRPEDPRGGGILGHAGIQSMLCWMGDNWVIYRGAWTLRHILDAPPPPPPLEVPELNPSEPGNHGKTFKELLQKHQQDPKCAVCHRSIDPLGFAFQNFDISGRWRLEEFDRYEKKELDGKIEWRGVGKTRPVDSVGRLPRGEEFKTFSEWKGIVVRNYQPDLVCGLMKNLLIYSTGRRPDIADLSEINAVMREQEPKGYPLRDLLKGVLRSRAFLGSE